VINHATVDLASPSYRIRFFGGRSAKEVADTMPILPVDAPGLPPLGTSLVQFARTLGDASPEVVTTKGRTKAKPARAHGPWLTALTRSLIYQNGTAVTLDAGLDKVSVPFMTGRTYIEGDNYVGPGACRLMIIGKCLGRTEVEQQKPFCGAGSEPLWRAWRDVGLPTRRGDVGVYLTNLIRFEPPNVMGTKIPKEWMNDGVHLLYQELVICRPEFVLVLGADALKALFGHKAKVSDYKGRLVPLEIDCRPDVNSPENKFTCNVVVADHPAAVSRDPDLYPSLISSMRYLARHMGYGEAMGQDLPTDYKAVLTLAELKSAVAETVRESANGGYVSFDCEWEGAHPKDPDAYLYTVQWSHKPGHSRVAYLRRCGGSENAAMPLHGAVPLLRRLFCDAGDRGARLVGHFAKADLPWLESVGVDLYPHFTAPVDDKDADGTEGRYWDWQRCYVEGAFDTYIAAHAVDESQPRGLEVLSSTLLGMDRYDVDISNWVAEYCKAQGIKRSALKGYGNIPEDRMTPYAAKDCDATGRLYLMYNGDPRNGTTGLLDKDRFGNNCRQIFVTRMQAWSAIAEMERYGMEVDYEAHKRLRGYLSSRREELISSLRKKIDWPEFDPAKRLQRLEFLFGELHATSTNKKPRPNGALSLYLTPYKATQSGGGKLWDEACKAAEHNGLPMPTPAADKETLITLSRGNPLVGQLLDIDYLGTAMKIMFRLPTEVTRVNDEDEGEEIHDRGFMHYVNHDNRIRTRIGHVETGRYSSSKPNLQNNVSEGMDENYDRILGWGKNAPEDSELRKLAFKSRTIMKAQDGWFIANADLKGAEIAMAGWYSGDEKLIEHARRSTLDESDLEWLDLHSDLAAEAFGLKIPLKEVKKQFKSLRTAAKRARFGHYYGASPDTIWRQVTVESPDVTVEQIQKIVSGHDKMYPVLAGFFAACRRRSMNPGWMCNGHGGYRRFRQVTDRELQAAQEREAQNWACQGGVADHIAKALGILWYDLRKAKMRSRIVLSVHDSIMVECPPDEIKIVAEEMLPAAMTTKTPVVVTSLDGMPLPRGPYFFGVDVTVYRNWGDEVPESEWRR